MTMEGRAAVAPGTPTIGLRSAVAAGALALALAACGSGPGDAGDGADGAADDGSSIPAGFGGLNTGGGGTLTFDGEEIEIASATCVIQGDSFDVGTVSDNGFRVFASQNNPQNPVSAQILDADGIQWFPEGNGRDEATLNGSTVTSEEQSYFNNSDDRTITASFTIECP